MITLVAVLTALFAILSIATIGTLKRQARIIHAIALQGCARWLPAVALAAYVGLLLACLFKGTASHVGFQSLVVELRPAEACILLLSALIFATKFVNFGAFATTLLYLFFLSSHAAGLSRAADVCFLLSQLVLLFMGDKASWQQSGANGYGVVARRIGITTLWLGSVIGISLALFSIEDVRSFLVVKLQLRLSKSLIIVILLSVLVGWSAAGIRSLRPFLIPLLALPTILAIEAVVPMGSTLSVVIFLVALSVSWATSERRYRPNPRIDGYFSRKISYR
ncbi:MAG: hypothetical protein FJ146_03460 [Deltaproteobacteria bacterium]|nr:hypothetical protein [Deltaproteobacteria bacterium]